MHDMHGYIKMNKYEYDMTCMICMDTSKGTRIDKHDMYEYREMNNDMIMLHDIECNVNGIEGTC